VATATGSVSFFALARPPRALDRDCDWASLAFGPCTASLDALVSASMNEKLESFTLETATVAEPAFNELGAIRTPVYLHVTVQDRRNQPHPRDTLKQLNSHEIGFNARPMSPIEPGKAGNRCPIH